MWSVFYWLLWPDASREHKLPYNIQCTYLAILLMRIPPPWAEGFDNVNHISLTLWQAFLFHFGFIFHFFGCCCCWGFSFFSFSFFFNFLFSPSFLFFFPPSFFFPCLFFLLDQASLSLLQKSCFTTKTNKQKRTQHQTIKHIKMDVSWILSPNT